MNLTPLTVSEARAIVRADEALDATFSVREASGTTLSSDETDAWIHLVKSAHARIAAYGGTKHEPPKELNEPKESVVEPYPGGNEPGFQTLFMEAVARHRDDEARAGYTLKRLTTADAAELAELLRVSIDDKHWQAWHPKLREIRERMIVRLGDST